MAQNAPPPRQRLTLVPPPSPLKSHDSIVAVVFSGRVARMLLPYARSSGLSPNQVTLLSLAVTFLAAPFIAFGGPTAWLLAAILVQIGFIGDCLDGQLARATGRGG